MKKLRWTAEHVGFHMIVGQRSYSCGPGGLIEVEDEADVATLIAGAGSLLVEEKPAKATKDDKKEEKA